MTLLQSQVFRLLLPPMLLLTFMALLRQQELLLLQVKQLLQCQTPCLQHLNSGLSANAYMKFRCVNGQVPVAHVSCFWVSQWCGYLNRSPVHVCHKCVCVSRIYLSSLKSCEALYCAMIGHAIKASNRMRGLPCKCVRGAGVLIIACSLQGRRSPRAAHAA